MAEPDSKHNRNPVGATLMVRVTVVREGTSGISLSLGGELIGEWTDSRARMLSLTDDYKVGIHGADGEPLYLFSAPGRVVAGEKLSDKEAAVTIEI